MAHHRELAEAAEEIEAAKTIFEASQYFLRRSFKSEHLRVF
jgi:hypothetical protein